MAVIATPTASGPDRPAPASGMDGAIRNAPGPAGSGPAVPRASDQITLSAAAPLLALLATATAGLQLLSSLLPVLERAMARPPVPEAALPLGHLAKSVAAAAQQLGTDAAILQHAPTPPALPALVPAALQRWRGDARDALLTASTLLEQAERRLQSPQAAAPTPDAVEAPLSPREANDVLALSLEREDTAPSLLPLKHAAIPLPLHGGEQPSTGMAPSDPAWAFGQLAMAQREIELALARVALAADRAPARPARRWMTRLAPPASHGGASDGSGAVGFGLVALLAFFGSAVAGLVLWLAESAWLSLAALGGLAMALAWCWRVVVTARRTRLELRSAPNS